MPDDTFVGHLRFALRYEPIYLGVLSAGFKTPGAANNIEKWTRAEPTGAYARRAWLLADLGVTKSHGRPHVSNDNPFFESHFKILKYQPRFPKCFGCIEDARQFCREFFAWYNQAHHHAGLGLMTPDQVHYGQINEIHAARQITLNAAFAAHPERFVKRPPTPPNRWP